MKTPKLPRLLSALVAVTPLLALGSAPLSAKARPAPQPAPHKAGPPRPFAALEMPTASTEIPLLPGDEIVVEVRVNGHGPYRFSLDTGAEGAGSLSRSLVKTLGLPVVGHALAGDPSGRNERQVDIVEAASLALGGAKFKRVALSVLDARPGPGGDFDGILGIRLFKDLLLTLDYPARRLRLEKGSLGPVDGKEILAFDAPHGVPRIVVTIGGLTVPVDIDCGNAQGELTLPTSYLGKVPLLRDPVVVGHARTGFNEFDIRQVPLKGGLGLGSQTIEGVRADFVDIFPVASVGNPFLRRFTVTIDGKNHRIRFHPGDHGAT
jgi:hypothetical protein